ncbi:ATP-binding protein [Paenibacillus sp. UNC217MF]|uniref:ATP-binding protein n=1 Tax=Paenibacillus sp. UNC217MF TaxID=1449062 RepID=UPI000491BB92|nr:ATP-binding protein [Paenibacillus sp. UNC217MF]
MPKVPFNVHAYTARLIGRENVSRLEGAVLELVKNTYDADASDCFIYYEESTGTLYIGDNGHGMTEEIIRRHWMTIGYSSKVDNYTTKKGRIQTGAKGIGRFALDRISDRCKMITISEKERLEWNVNWSDFSSGNTITDIYADLNSIKYSIEDFMQDIQNESLKKLVSQKFKNTGTIFKLSILRDEWSSSLIEGIRNNLATLIPPEIENVFRVYFFCENTDITKAAVTLNDGNFSYDYKIKFKANTMGRVIVEIYREEFDFQDQFDRVFHEAGFPLDEREHFKGKPIVHVTTISNLVPKKTKIKNTLGKFSGVLYFSKLSASKEEKEKYYYKDFSGRKDFRDTFGGIKLYRDNFRVRPYGEPRTSNYDWLLLSNRKTKSPAAISHPNGKWRVTADQILGSVYISRTNLTLPDQANREGIVETKEFGNFREVIKGVISLFEEDRQKIGRILSKYYDEIHFTEQYEEEILKKAEKEEKDKSKNNSNKSPAASTQFIEVSKAKTVIENKENIIRDLEDENRLLRALATTGIVTNTYIHEIKDSTHKLSMKIVMAKEALEIDNDKEEAIEYINAANEIKNSFNSWFKVTIESVRRDKRTMKNVDLKQLLQTLVNSWNEVAWNKDIRINLQITDIFFTCFSYEIESVFNNLITNSITSFESAKVEVKEININVVSSDSGIVIDYEDSGVGLSPAYKNTPRRILEPSETDKRNEFGETIGTGMGMWVIAKTVSEYNGEIDLSKNTNSTSGFHIRITLNESRIRNKGGA